MGVEEMFGVFIIMLGGIGLGLVLLFCELIVGSCRDVNRKGFDKVRRRSSVTNGGTGLVYFRSQDC